LLNLAIDVRGNRARVPIRASGRRFDFALGAAHGVCRSRLRALRAHELLLDGSARIIAFARIARRGGTTRRGLRATIRTGLRHGGRQGAV
jgi:hypothetical protein